MYSIVRSKKAELDLIGHWQYVAQHSEAAADALLDSIEERCTRLGQFPHSCPARDDIYPGVRCLVVGEYLVLYQVDDVEVFIVRIVHGKRDLNNLFML